MINAGVRQIAILADDAANYNNTGNLGGNNYARLLNDMTTWLSEMKETYPDLKMTLPFCTVEYYGNGESYYSGFPENVQIVMTGGRIWGEVSDSFTSTFTNNAGRGPYMWVNWPCTDNSKNHLIMGGYSTFLHPGVDPDKIQGIVLNPMQQSEPSKVAIFGNACYSWNIWDSTDEADQAWNDSFKYVDHNSAIETDASNALRELSKHMINQNMDSRVTALQESVDLEPLLTDFKDKLNTNTVTEEDVDALISEFEVLQEAADVYEAQAGDTKVRDQIIYWLDCWDDTTDAAIAYLNGVKAVINNDTTAILQYNTEGKTAFDNSKTHALWYLDHYEYAEVGVQHIVPFIEAAADYVSKYAETAMNPDAVIRSYITNRTDAPASGSTDDLFDGDDATQVSYRNPNRISEGDYIGVLYNKVIDIDYIRFYLDDGRDHFDQAELQYTMDGREWQAIELNGMENSFAGVQGQYQEVLVEEENLPEGFQAMGIRLIATQDNAQDAWFTISEIQINKSGAEEPEGQERLTGTVTYNGISVRNGAQESAYFDGSNSTEVQLAKGPYEGSDREIIAAGSTITVTFDEPKTVGSFRLVQGASASADVFGNADVEYQLEGDVTALKAEISTYESLAADKDLYTAESWTAYENAVNAGKALLEAGTQQQIKDALSAIAAANEGLVLKEDLTVQDMIDAAEAILNAEGSKDKYTTDSYTTLADIVAEAKENLDDESYIEKIQSAIDGLVNVEALKAQIAAAQNVDKDVYTISSYKGLSDLLGQTDALLKSGSKEDVDAMTKAIDNAIRALKPRATGVDDYRDSIILKPEKGYTADSYKAYKEAYEALMNADASDLSAEEFAKLKADFERAELALKTVSTDKPAAGDKDKGDTAVATGDQASAAPIVIVLILCVAVIAAVIIIRKKRK